MKYTLLLGSLILFGCQGLPPPDGPTPAYKNIRIGSQLTVNQALTIPANQVSIFFQHGKEFGQTKLNQYHPNCKIELFTMQDKARMINPGAFKITRVATRIETVSLEGMLFTALGMFIDGDGGPGSVNYITEFFLQSAEQPDVYRLSCAHWEDPRDARHLSTAQISEALGKIITIRQQ